MKKGLKITLIIFLSILIIGIVFTIVFINNIMGINKVEFDKNKLIMANTETVIYDNNNEEIKDAIKENKVVKIDELPNYVIDAFISIEDKDFFKHKGLNYKRIFKAMLNNIKSMSFKEGASTISQQLIKNTHLTNEKTIKRKVKEMLLTKKLEKEFSKKDILETYLNIIYFGENAYGIDNASNRYFNKSANNLTLSESATLAGLIKSPLKFSPIYNMDNCVKRRNLVLNEMLKDKKISKLDYEKAVNENIVINQPKLEINEKDVYTNAVLNEVCELLNINKKQIRQKNLKIYSYYDSFIQNTLFKELNNKNNYHKNKYGNCSDSLSIIIDNKTLGVSGFYGKSKYNLTNFNRQPGSAIKPILVYAPAIERGIVNPATLILDEPINYSGYSPNNVGGNKHGYISVNDCIGLSLNIPAVKVLDYVGIENAKNFAKSAGIKFDKNDKGYAIALGGFTKGVSLKELTNSFVPFANAGMFGEAKFVKKIYDNNGKLIYEHNKKENKIMGEDTAYLMTEMMQKACKKGTSSKLKNLDFDVASKTGTVAIKGTNYNTDAYSVAYTTNHTIGVWMGNYSNDSKFVMEGKNNGGTYATQTVNECFKTIYSKTKPINFNKPTSVEEVEIDAKAYRNEHLIKLCGKNCPERYKLKINVAKRYKPKETSDLFEHLEVNNFNVHLKNNTAIIEFDSLDYLKYEIYKIDNGKQILLRTINNKNEHINIFDKNLQYNTKYGYYVKVIAINNNNQSFSDTINIVTPTKKEKYNKLIKQNNNDNMWLFR